MRKHQRCVVIEVADVAGVVSDAADQQHADDGAAAIQLANSGSGTPNTVILGSLPVLEGTYAGLLNNTDGNGVVQMRAPAGTLTVPGLAIGQSNSGLWAPSATALAMSANGGEVLRITQGGVVTLGGASAI
jgi:hypothetical protein